LLRNGAEVDTLNNNGISPLIKLFKSSNLSDIDIPAAINLLINTGKVNLNRDVSNGYSIKENLKNHLKNHKYYIMTILIILYIMINHYYLK